MAQSAAIRYGDSNKSLVEAGIGSESVGYFWSEKDALINDAGISDKTISTNKKADPIL